MNKDNELMAERCKQELMKLYQGGNNTEIQPEIEVDEEVVEETEEVILPENNDDTADIAERFPEPDISIIEEETNEVSDSEIGDSSGFILVNVRTGDDAIPIEKATVTVSATVDGKRLFIAATVTDISGSTAKIEVPAPNTVYSLAPNPKVRPYSLFDISVVAQGFFNAVSVDVPVFSGITSIQNFNMVPVPLYTKSTDETLTYYNQEPDL